MRQTSQLEVAGRTLQVSNLEKVLYPEPPFKKGQVIDYYIRAGDVLLPHLRDRPLTFKRYPDGVRGPFFYEKNAPSHTPAWVKRHAVPRRSRAGNIHYVLINDLPTLVWTANLANLEIHTLLARVPQLERPTMIMFDLDPGESADILHAGEVAVRVKEILDRLQLESFVKVSGSKGVHLHVPLNTPTHYDVTQQFARRLAEVMAHRCPDDVVSQMPKHLRRGKVFIDWSQNHEHKTTVSAYSLRAKHDRPFVAAPITWQELRRALKKADADALFFGPEEVLARIDKMGDLFEPLLTCRQKCSASLIRALDQQETAEASKGAPRRQGRRSAEQANRRDTSITAYRAKRDFRQTAEPPPEPSSPRASADEPLFVVQKHQASHLHYDFRLQAEGVLWSWAVPKGVPSKAGEKRLAMRTEDHPVEYARFEGTIPPGNYGAGTVMVWDTGHYALRTGTPAKAMKSGKLSLTLHGKKLKGDWTLFRARTRDGDEGRETWYLLKAHQNARPISKRRDDQSVVSGRTMKQIAADPGAQWTSNRASKVHTAGAQPSPAALPLDQRLRRKIARLPKAPPRLVKPMECKEVKEVPEGDGWVYEILFDGYRTLALKKGETVQLRSPDARSLEKKFPRIVEAIAQLTAQDAVLDGMIVALDSKGRSSGKLLRQQRQSAVFYYAFDLLHLDGRNLSKLPLVERKDILRALLAGPPSSLRLSPRFESDAEAVVAEFERHGLGGVIAKRARSAYEPGKRSGAWVKRAFQ